MVPLADCPEVLRRLRAVSPARLASDLSADAADTAVAEFRAYHQTPSDRRSSAAEAEQLHRRLVRASRAAAQPGPPDPVAAHLAWEAARAVARLAVRVAAGAGELGRLLGTLGRMDAVADAGGGPGWLATESDEYERLAGRATVLAGRIERVVVSDTLRRYRLTALADLYDADELGFHRLAAAGRRLLTGRDRPWPTGGGWF